MHDLKDNGDPSLSGRQERPTTTKLLANEWLAEYATIDADIAELPDAMRMRIDREERRALESLHRGLPLVLRSTLQVSAATFAAVKRLCYDRSLGEPPAPHFSVAVAPIARTFLDSLIAIVFVCDKPATNVDRYLKGGLCKAVAEYERLKAEYGSDPAWTFHIDTLRTWIDSHESGDPTCRVILSADEKASPDKCGRELWPNPGQLIALCSKDIGSYLSFVREWHYDELSQDSHLSYMGTVRRAIPLHDESLGPIAEEYRLRMFYKALTLYLALLAEIGAAARLRADLARIARVWKQLHGNPDADQLWIRRYRELLTQPTPGRARLLRSTDIDDLP